MLSQLVVIGVRGLQERRKVAGDMNVIRPVQSEWSLRKLLGPSRFQLLFSKMKSRKWTARTWSQRVTGTASPCLTQASVSSPQGSCPGKLFPGVRSGSRQILGLSEGPSAQWGAPLKMLCRFIRAYTVCLKALPFVCRCLCPCLSSLLAKLGLSPWPVPGQ